VYAGGIAGLGAFLATVLTNENGEEGEGGIDRGATLASTQEGRTTRSLETRASILDAAIAEFAERGFEGASIRAIADRLGLQHPLITYHYRTKDILWRAAAEHAFAQIKAAGIYRRQKAPICRHSPDCERNTLRCSVTLSHFLNFTASCVRKH